MGLSYRIPGSAAACLFAGFFAASTVASAQARYPERQIKLVVPFPAGGTVDAAARVVTPRLAERLGQSIVIENKGGAGGMLGSADVAKAAPDGHTILMVFDTHAVNHHLYRNIAFDTFTAFQPISLMASSPMTLVVSTKLGTQSVQALVDKAKAQPGTVTFGHVGPGSSNQLVALQFQKVAGLKLNQVAYRGGGPLLNDLLGGHVDMAFASLPLVVNQIGASQLIGLGVAAKDRVQQLPQAQKIAEIYPEFVASSWVGMLVPAGVARPVVDKLHAEVTATIQEPAIRERLEQLGFVIEASTPEAFATFIKAESDKWGAVIRENSVTAAN